MNPRFSVIVPLYNKAPYIKKALDSIASQSFKDWECIIVDDGSTDNSLAVVKECIEQFRIYNFNFQILSQKNVGVAAARNNGVVKSKGEYVCFLDADDWWEPEFLEEMDRLIEEYPDAGLYATNYVYYKPGKTHVALNLARGYMNYPEAYLHGEMPVWTGATCMLRKVFDEMGGFPVGIKLGEDFLLWAKTAIKYKVAFCEKPLASYNNDVPACLRATRNLHAPEHHMLFHLEEIEKELRAKSEEVRGDCKELRAKSEEVRGDCKELRAKSEEVRGDCKELSAKSEEVRGDCKELRAKSEEVRGDCKELRAKSEEVKGDCKELRAKSEEVRGDCKELRGRNEEQIGAWIQLIDKLRISGLMDYWLSDEYHAAAEVELKKVDWSRQPRSAKSQYEKPIWALKAKRRFMQFGSAIKQRLIRWCIV